MSTLNRSLVDPTSDIAIPHHCHRQLVLIMLLSPASCHEQLQSLLDQLPGPHTALLATPNGQLVCCASRERLDEPEGESTNEPWLDEPERIRLLLGLLSQWEQDESPRIECEVIYVGYLTWRDLLMCPAWKAVRAISTSTSTGKHVVQPEHASSAGSGNPTSRPTGQRHHQYGLGGIGGKSE